MLRKLRDDGLRGSGVSRIRGRVLVNPSRPSSSFSPFQSPCQAYGVGLELLLWKTLVAPRRQP